MTARLALASAIALPLPALPADPLTDAMRDAYVPYRAALFRTNGKSQAEAEQALAQARQAWEALRRQYGERPPIPYDRDPKFAETLLQVSTIYERAAEEIGANRLPAAHETLEAVRDQLAELRRRNDVVVFSDHMNAYHAEMEGLLAEGAKAPATQAAWMALAERVGVLGYLARKLRSDAPPALWRDADFEIRLKAVEASVGALRSAVQAHDEAALREAVSKLKGQYSRLFLAYG